MASTKPSEFCRIRSHGRYYYCYTPSLVVPDSASISLQAFSGQGFTVDNESEDEEATILSNYRRPETVDNGENHMISFTVYSEDGDRSVTIDANSNTSTLVQVPLSVDGMPNVE